jgi:hypothetical protein
MQKTEFLKALSDMWKDFDARVLRYKVCSVLQSIFYHLPINTTAICLLRSNCGHHFLITMYCFIEATRTCIFFN